jgi:hypothetical protein
MKFNWQPPHRLSHKDYSPNLAKVQDCLSQRKPPHRSQNLWEIRGIAPKVCMTWVLPSLVTTPMSVGFLKGKVREDLHICDDDKTKCHMCALLAHACNPSYSGGRDQEDHGSKPAPGKWFVRAYLEKTHHK